MAHWKYNPSLAMNFTTVTAFFPIASIALEFRGASKLTVLDLESLEATQMISISKQAAMKFVQMLLLTILELNLKVSMCASLFAALLFKYSRILAAMVTLG